jgi:hypothetical protein
MHDLAIYAGDLLVAIACHLAAWTAGAPIYRYIVGRESAGRGGAEAAFFSTILGFVAYGYAAFALGALGLLYAPLLAACVVVPAVFGAARLVKTRAWRACKPTTGDATFVLAAAVICAMIPVALAPVLEHDDNVYHLFLPRIYLEHHGLFYLPHINANMPHLVELLYLFPSSLGDFTAAKCLNLFFNLWIIVGLRSVLRGPMGRPLAGVAGLIYLSNPCVQWHLGRAYIEPVMGTFLLGGAIALLRFIEGRQTAYLWLAGIACGAAAGSKYQGWVFSAAILVFIGAAIVNQARAWSLRAAWALAAFSGFAVLVLPWAVKNLVMTGNPVYPMAYRVLGGKDLSSIQVFQMVQSFSQFGGPKTLANLSMLPFRLMVPPNTDFEPSCSATMMVLVLVAVMLIRWQRSSYRYLIGVAIVGFAGWALTCQLSRYLEAWLPVMTLVAMLPLGRLAARRGIAEGLAVIVVAVAGVQQYRVPVATTLGVPALAVFSHPRDQLLALNLNFGLCEYLNREVPPGAKVLGMWENRFYFLRREALCDSVYEAPSELAWLRRLDDPGRFADELRALGVTHVVVNTHVAELYFAQKLGYSMLDDRVYPASRFERDRALLHEFLKEELSPVVTDDTDVVFRVKSRESLKDAAGPHP